GLADPLRPESRHTCNRAARWRGTPHDSRDRGARISELSVHRAAEGNGGFGPASGTDRPRGRAGDGRRGAQGSLAVDGRRFDARASHRRARKWAWFGKEGMHTLIRRDAI